MEPTLLHGFLERAAQRAPESTAIVHGTDRVAYGELDAAANRVARMLVGDGVRPGDRVGILDENGAPWVAAYYGAMKAGAVAVPLNSQSDPATLAAQLADCEAAALLLGARHAGAASWAEPLPGLRRRGIREADGFDGGSAPGVRRIDLDRAAIIYTSGSTGRPKGAVLRHLSLVSNTRSIVAYLGLRPDDRVLVVLPFFYVYGTSLLNTHVAAGGSVVVENRFLFPQTAVDTLEREACTGFSGVPSTFAILLDRTNVAKRSFPALRYLTQAGGAMAPALTLRVLEAFPGKRLFVMYGATEASARLSYLPPEELPARVGSIGKAIPNVELRVLREDGTPCEPGEVGEIVARGSNLMEGYWNDPVETAQVLDAAGYHTGDLGVADADGFLRVVGRKREMIKSGAHRISPKEIEEALLEHPDVLECAVIGVPDSLLGERIRAYVVGRDGRPAPAGDGLAAHARERLAAYKVPHEFVPRPALPKNASGKVMKEALRADSREER